MNPFIESKSLISLLRYVDFEHIENQSVIGRVKKTHFFPRILFQRQVSAYRESRNSETRAGQRMTCTAVIHRRFVKWSPIRFCHVVLHTRTSVQVYRVTYNSQCAVCAGLIQRKRCGVSVTREKSGKQRAGREEDTRRTRR